jgi:hypothetical protein
VNTDTTRFPATAERVDRVLREARYVRVRTLRIGEVPFDVEYAYLAGPGFLDLVLLMDASAPASQIYWLAERVASALDSVGSRRPLTYVLVGDVSNLGVVTDDLIRLGRVVNVTGSAHVAEELAPLLPMVMDEGVDVEEDPLGQLDVTAGNQEGDAKVMAALLDAARGGPKAVEAGLAKWFDAAFADRSGR